MGGNQKYCFEFGEFRLDPVERRLVHNGKVIPMSPKSFDTLCLLVENGGHLIEKDRLMEILWADAFVEEGNLADNISKIRQALGDSRKDPRFIETVSGRGYRFVADVRRIEIDVHESRVERKSEPSAARDAVTTAELNPSEFQLQVDKSKISDSAPGNIATKIPVTVNRRLLVPVSVSIILALIAAGFYLWSGNEKSADTTVKTFAVLPFKPLVAENRDESFEMGISDSLINKLARLRQITVRPISAVRRYTSMEQDAVAAGRELNVESVLDGSIQRAGERIRITARLVRVEDGSTLWTETFDEKYTDIFAVQDSISQKIVGALALHLSGEERNQLTKKYTTSTEAYEFYLKGRYFWNKTTPEGFEKSLQFYRQAIDLDPNYALAYAGLADSYNLLGSYGVLPLNESHPKARSAAERALELDEELAEAHTSLAAVIADYYWDWAEAEKHFKQAIALNPNYPVARYWYSQYLGRMGRLDESIEEAKRARGLDLLSPSAIAHVGLAYYRARRYDDAIAELEKAREIGPDALDVHIFLGFVYIQQGKNDEAIAEFQIVSKLSERTPSMLALLGYAYAMAGKHDEAREILKELNLRSSTPVSPFEAAMIYIGLGDHEQAFAWLERAYNERAWQLGFLKVEPIFDPLRPDPRFTDLMRRVNLIPQ